MNQTETYIVLKPLSERFNKIAKEITDDDIRRIIKDELKKQIEKSIDFTGIQEIIECLINEQEDKIKGLIMESIKNKF